MAYIPDFFVELDTTEENKGTIYKLVSEYEFHKKDLLNKILKSDLSKFDQIRIIDKCELLPYDWCYQHFELPDDWDPIVDSYIKKYQRLSYSDIIELADGYYKSKENVDIVINILYEHMCKHRCIGFIYDW